MMFDGVPKKNKKGSPIIKFVGLNHGIPEFESRWLDNLGAVTPGPFIIYPTDGSNNTYYNTHEPGHVIQFAILGPSYYTFIALPSLITASFNFYSDMPWEKSENRLWYWCTGEYDLRWNPLYFPPKE